MARPTPKLDLAIARILETGLTEAGSDRQLARELGIAKVTVTRAKQVIRRTILEAHVNRAIENWAPVEVQVTTKTDTPDGEETIRMKLVPPVETSGETVSTFDPDDPCYVPPDTL